MLVIPTYLEMLDSQREMTFATLSGLRDDQIWQRPGSKDWCIGELLNHNYLLMASAMAYVRFIWRYFSWYGKRNRLKPYKNDIPDFYSDGKFPMWVGFLWTPRFHPYKPVTVDQLITDLRNLHRDIRSFYQSKDEDILGNIAVYDPYFGWLNLIVTLRLGIYHDRLHFEDAIKLANSLKGRL